MDDLFDDIKNITDSVANSSSSSSTVPPAGSPNARNSDNDSKYFKNMDKSLEEIQKSMKAILELSQSEARDRDRENREGTKSSSKSDKKKRSKFADMDFLDSFERSLYESVGGSDFEKKIKKSLDGFAEQLGTDIKGIQGELGHKIGDQAMNMFKDTKIGKSVTSKLEISFDSIAESFQNRGQSVLDFAENGFKFGDIETPKFDAAIEGISEGFSKLRSSSSVVDKAASAAGKALGMLPGPSASSAVAMAKQALQFTKGLGPTALFLGAIDGAGQALVAFGKLFEAMGKAANRSEESRQKKLELAQERLQKDIETLVKKPFEILEEAAQAWYDAWDSNLQLINTTQGYTKADLQDLMSWYAQKLRDEGLSSYVSAADITTNLANVLTAGLSGEIAEEFAYQATRLNAIVPTEDFFSYASTYASVAANAVREGKTQTEAIAEATSSLQTFAAGLVYASRELTGGFTTGLTSASSIYESAVKASLAGNYTNTSDLAAIMLAVSAEVGAIAPDLASTMTDTIYSLLTGGNSTSLVALRALSGLGASNTEFIQAVSSNPASVFATIFSNLDALYSQSPDAYMEKAEAYAELFGLSAEAFQRVDFGALATAITRMSMSDDLINENISLLKAGETTTTAEQLRYQQINQYMIDEGLAYVLDNEAARAIQQHMWDEQLAQEMMEATYAVDLTGSGLEFLNDISNAVNAVIQFLNPFSWLSPVANLIQTVAEGSANEEKIAAVLQAGVVGQGNSQDFYNLTTRGVELNLTEDLVTLLGGNQYLGMASDFANIMSGVSEFLDAGAHLTQTIGGGIINAATSALKDAWVTGLNAINGSGTSFGGSSYTWGSLGSKSAASLSSTLLNSLSPTLTTPTIYSATTGAKSTSASVVNSAIEKMLDDSYLVDQYVNEGKTYDDWAASASDFNITDLSAALTEAGYSESDVKEYFLNQQTKAGQQILAQTAEEEKIFRDTGIQFWTEDFPNDYRDPLFSRVDYINENLETIIQNQLDWRDYYQAEWLEKGWDSFVSLNGSGEGLFEKFYKEFMMYFIDHYYYDNTEGYTYSDVEAIQAEAKAQENGDTVYALAEMLTKNLVDLKDPTMQTNAILGQILIVATAIMEQGNTIATTTGAGELINTLSGLSLGLTSTSTSIDETVLV